MKKTTQLKNLLNSNQLEFIIEAHNGISAKIVEETGFKGIWGSGLSLAAQFGVRYNNEASWTKVLEVLEFMSDATTIPILLDGDTGYGNFNNMQRLVQKLEQRDIAGVCIEDKLFPKTNSFIKGNSQPLANIDEFAGKIKAGKDAQKDSDFVIVARIETFIAGWGLEEALKRAEAYHKAGADAILIHSALNVPDEVLAFKKELGNLCPVVIVPTKYYSTPTEVFSEQGFSLVIWANHLLRSSVAAMQKTASNIYKRWNLLSTEDVIVPVKEIFRLQGAEALKEAEKRYLPKPNESTTAIILAASRGKELGKLTETKPKAMVDIAGKPLIAHIVNAYNSIGMKDIIVVRGYKKETVNLPGIKYADHDDYENFGELVSLQIALKALETKNKDVIISYGDVIFNHYVPKELTEKEDDLVIAVDTNWKFSTNSDSRGDYVQASIPNSREAFYNKVTLQKITNKCSKDEIDGEWMGFLKISSRILPKVCETLDQLLEKPENKMAQIPTLINQLNQDELAVRIIYTTGHWLDIDSIQDVINAGNFYD